MSVFMPVLCRYFCLCSVQFILLVFCAVFMLVDCAVCSTLLAPLVAGASRPLGSLREPFGAPCDRYLTLLTGLKWHMAINGNDLSPFLPLFP